MVGCEFVSVFLFWSSSVKNNASTTVYTNKQGYVRNSSAPESLPPFPLSQSQTNKTCPDRDNKTTEQHLNIYNTWRLRGNSYLLNQKK